MSAVTILRRQIRGMTMIYRFGNHSVDDLRHSVACGDTEILFEPKAFGVLLELLRHPGELMTRDRLLDAVWGHRHVTPATLNRVIAQLRRGLNDPAEQPHYIETVHRLGYRFIADVEIEGTVNQAHAPGHESTPTDGRRSWNANVQTLLWFSSLLVLVIVGAGVWLLAARTATVAQRSTDLATLAVLPFRNQTGDPALDATGEILADVLLDALSRMRDLQVAGRESSFALGRGGSSPGRVADELGVDYVLTGELTPGINDALGLRTVLWSRRNAIPQWTHVFQSTRSTLFEVPRPLLRALRMQMLPHTPANDGSTLSPRLEAKDLYWLGRHYAFQRTPQSLARALKFFEQAIAADPGSALAYCGNADTYMLLYEYGNLTLDEAAAMSRAALDRARALDPQLQDIDASEGLILLNEERFDDAVRVLARAYEKAPHEPKTLLWYGNALAYTGQVVEALSIHRSALELDPLNAVLHTYAGVDLTLAGKAADAERHLQRALQLNADYAEAYWQSALNRQFQGRVAEAIGIYAGIDVNQASIGWTSLNLIHTFLQANDTDNARRALHHTDGISPMDRLEGRIAVRLAERDPAAALADLDTSSLARSPRWHALHARVLALTGQVDKARVAYHEAFGDSPSGDAFLRVWLPDLGLGHLANHAALEPAGSATRAVLMQAMRHQLDALQAGGMKLPVLRYQQAMAAALAGEEESARHAIEEALASGWLDSQWRRRDLIWRELADRAWVVSMEERIEQRAAEQRKQIETVALPAYLQ